MSGESRKLLQPRLLVELHIQLRKRKTPTVKEKVRKSQLIYIYKVECNSYCICLKVAIALNILVFTEFGNVRTIYSVEFLFFFQYHFLAGNYHDMRIIHIIFYDFLYYNILSYHARNVFSIQHSFSLILHRHNDLLNREFELNLTSSLFLFDVCCLG